MPLWFHHRDRTTEVLVVTVICAIWLIWLHIQLISTMLMLLADFEQMLKKILSPRTSRVM